MKTLRAGLLGLGMMGRHHARVLRSLDGVNFVAAADPGGDRHKSAKDIAIYESLDELIAAGIDYCVVAVPTAFHESAALHLAEAGVHALIEKPLAHDYDSAARIASTFEQRGLVGGVGQIERYNAAAQQARLRIQAGEIGDVLQVSTRRQGPFPGRIADVGVVKDLGSHDIDLAAWITQQEYVSVSAATVFRSGRPHEDLVAITGKLSGGTLVNHLVNWLSPFKERTTTVTGEKGALLINTLTSDLTFYANGSVPTAWEDLARFRGMAEGDVIRYAFPKPEPLRTEHEAFRDAVLGVSDNHVSMREGLQVVAVSDAILSASEAGEWIDCRRTRDGLL